MAKEGMQSKVGRKEFVFTGRFGSVSSFVAMLVGESPDVIMNDTFTNLDSKDRELYKAKYSDWLQRWEKWKLGFNPGEEVQWKFLHRQQQESRLVAREELVSSFRSSAEIKRRLSWFRSRTAWSRMIRSAASLESQTVFKPAHLRHNFPLRNVIRLLLSARDV
jgi:hypothetical protein